LPPNPLTKPNTVKPHQPLDLLVLGLFFFLIQKEPTMTHKDIIAHLCQLYPPQVIHSITTENIISAIVRRMGEEALDLSVEDLELARDEVRAAIEHHLDEREYIDIGLDAWEILRSIT
jgi:hypothetical protein